jgi:hypothetical protein
LAVSCFVIVKILGKPYSYFFGTGLLIISTWYSYKELDKRLGLVALFKKYMNKK